MQKVLHVGCGGGELPPWLSPCVETRLDVEPSARPDIVASMTDMGDVGTYDVIYCSHALEHLHPADVLKALGEFKRCLKPDGCAVVIVPDCEGIAPDFKTVYVTGWGQPVTGYDMHYGASWVTQTQPYMRHQMAFVKETLEAAIEGAGFQRAAVKRTAGYNLLGVMAP